MRDLYRFLCMLPMSVARSPSGMFTIGHIAYRREGVFFPTENALAAGKGGRECTARGSILSCHVISLRLISKSTYDETDCASSF